MILSHVTITCTDPAAAEPSLVDADFEDMEAISLELLSLYRWPSVQMESVEREITKLKEEYQVYICTRALKRLFPVSGLICSVHVNFLHSD